MLHPVTSDNGMDLGHGVRTIGPAMRLAAASMSWKVTDILEFVAFSRTQQVQMFARNFEGPDCCLMIDFDRVKRVKMQTEDLVTAYEIGRLDRVFEIHGEGISETK